MKMTPTPYTEVNQVIGQLLSEMRRIFGPRLVGIYVYGSLVTGDFDINISDIDLLAVLSSAIEESESAELNQMHQDFARAHVRWNDRIEVAYVSAAALQTFRTCSSMIGIISPGEPFHLKEAGIEWLVNWYVVREYGKVITGPLPHAIIAPISKEEFQSVVYRHAIAWREWIKDLQSRGAQAYAILTMCRAYYTLKTGEHDSKKQAALWVEKEWPQWSELIQQALVWRQSHDENIDHDATLQQTRQFVHFAINRCEALQPCL